MMADTPKKITVSEICDALGRQAIKRRVGVGLTAVSNAVVDGRFPASWYAVIKSMCDDAGIDCPLDAFNWKGQVAPVDLPTPPTEDAA